jgi:hypothetical protein
MKYRTTLLVWVCLLAVPSMIGAQDGNDDPSFSSNIGISLSAPLGPLSRYASVVWGQITARVTILLGNMLLWASSCGTGSMHMILRFNHFALPRPPRLVDTVICSL